MMPASPIHWHKLPEGKLPPQFTQSGYPLRLLIAILRNGNTYVTTGAYSTVGPPHWNMDEDPIGELLVGDPRVLAWAELPVYDGEGR